LQQGQPFLSTQSIAVMKQLILVKYALPFIFWFSLMVFTAIAIDYLLHHFHLVAIGRYLGYMGTLTIIVSFIYSLRKRKFIETGSPKQLLFLHEYLAWAGSVMLLVHAGIHYNAHLPWLAVFMLLINVASGLVGKFLLKKSGDSLNESRLALTNTGMTNEEIDKTLFFDAVTVKVMRQWRAVHLPIALLFGILSILHIFTVFMFAK
jgi:hypothetical protein